LKHLDLSSNRLSDTLDLINCFKIYTALTFLDLSRNLTTHVKYLFSILNKQTNYYYQTKIERKAPRLPHLRAPQSHPLQQRFNSTRRVRLRRQQGQTEHIAHTQKRLSDREPTALLKLLIRH
jgi:hypothetical protein